MLNPTDRLEHAVYSFQAKHNFDADLRQVEPELINPLTIEDCMALHQITQMEERVECLITS